MKFAVVGAGATGAYLGAKLAHAGEDVTLIARGAQLLAMQTYGVRVIETESGEEVIAHPPATDDMDAVRAADVVFLTVKAHSVAAIAPQLGAALGPTTVVVTAQNGIPWWYFERYDGPLAHTSLRTVDADGVIARSIAIERVIGCVVWPATRLVEPGVIEHVEGTRFTIGELDGTQSERCQMIAAALINAGLQCPIAADIRCDIWVKLLGNVALNPLSVLARATLEQICLEPETRAVARAMMEEVASVARTLGVDVSGWIDRRLNGAAKVVGHKTSMLQDLECGRPMEVEPMIGAVVELGDLLGLSLPHLHTVYACSKLLEQVHQKQREASQHQQAALSEVVSSRT